MGNNSGQSGAKNPAMRKIRGKFRFNANPTPCNHAGCFISARSRQDKKNALGKPPVVKVRISKARGMFQIG